MPTAVLSDQVQVVEQHAVRCRYEESLATHETPFKLGPLDQLVLPFVPIALVYVYEKPALDFSSKFISVKRLQRALELLLDYYPHLTGRLQKNPSNNTYEVASLGTGAGFFVAQCSARLDEMCSSSGRILMPKLPDAGDALLAPFDLSLEGATRDPIFTVQHTRFACGGVSLGIRLHHIVCDSEGYFQLVRDLAEIYRGLRSSETLLDGASREMLARPPHIRSHLWEPEAMTPEERQAALEFQPSMYYIEQKGDEKTGAPNSTDPPSIQPPVVGHVLRFSGSQLNNLKLQATDPSGQGWVSTFEALSAYIYQLVYRARIQLHRSQGMTQQAATSELSRAFLTPINLRGATRLDLPTRYFANAVSCPYTNVPHDVLTDGPLWQVAKTLHDWLHSFDAQEARQTTRWIAAQPDKSRIKRSFQFGNGNFIVSQWSKFNMHKGVEFDVDQHGDAVPPVLVSPPFTPISLVDGLALFLSTEEQLQPSSVSGTSAIDVNLTLIEPLWSILDEDEEFQKFLSR